MRLSNSKNQIYRAPVVRKRLKSRVFRNFELIKSLYTVACDNLRLALETISLVRSDSLLVTTWIAEDTCRVWSELASCLRLRLVHQSVATYGGRIFPQQSMIVQWSLSQWRRRGGEWVVSATSNERIELPGMANWLPA